MSQDIGENYRMTHGVLTGRDASPELIAAPDLANEKPKVRHPFQDGIIAQRAVEF